MPPVGEVSRPSMKAWMRISFTPGCMGDFGQRHEMVHVAVDAAVADQPQEMQPPAGLDSPWRRLP